MEGFGLGLGRGDFSWIVEHFVSGRQNDVSRTRLRIVRVAQKLGVHLGEALPRCLYSGARREHSYFPISQKVRLRQSAKVRVCPHCHIRGDGCPSCP